MVSSLQTSLCSRPPEQPQKNISTPTCRRLNQHLPSWWAASGVVPGPSAAGRPLCVCSRVKPDVTKRPFFLCLAGVCGIMCLCGRLLCVIRAGAATRGSYSQTWLTHTRKWSSNMRGESQQESLRRLLPRCFTDGLFLKENTDCFRGTQFTACLCWSSFWSLQIHVKTASYNIFLQFCSMKAMNTDGIRGRFRETVSRVTVSCIIAKFPTVGPSLLQLNQNCSGSVLWPCKYSIQVGESRWEYQRSPMKRDLCGSSSFQSGTESVSAGRDRDRDRLGASPVLWSLLEEEIAIWVEFRVFFQEIRLVFYSSFRLKAVGPQNPNNHAWHIFLTQSTILHNLRGFIGMLRWSRRALEAGVPQDPSRTTSVSPSGHLMNETKEVAESSNQDMDLRSL